MHFFVIAPHHKSDHNLTVTKLKRMRSKYTNYEKIKISNPTVIYMRLYIITIAIYCYLKNKF